MNDQRFPELALPLARAARELGEQTPPLTLLPAIHRQLAGRPQRRSIAQRMTSWLAWGGLVTGCTALSVMLVLGSVLDDESTSAGASTANGFVAVAGEQAWREVARDGGVWLVSTEIPQSRLAALGLPYDPARAAEPVPAQLLMHGSGNVLAVRVIR